MMYNFNSALKKNFENKKGTGGGRGNPLNEAEDIALTAMQVQGSDLVEGIQGGFESSVGSGSSLNVTAIQVIYIVFMLQHLQCT